MDEAALALEDTFEYFSEKCFEIPKTGKIIYLPKTIMKKTYSYLA